MAIVQNKGMVGGVKDPHINAKPILITKTPPSTNVLQAFLRVHKTKRGTVHG